VHQFEFCRNTKAKKAACPERRTASTKATVMHGGFVVASPSRDLRDGGGDFARKLTRYWNLIKKGLDSEFKFEAERINVPQPLFRCGGRE